MLPEYLYTTGSTSMQDIVRDDFNLLNGAHNTANKDICSDFSSTNNLNKHTDCVNPYDLSTLNSIKLEETSQVDLFPTHPNTWQQHPLNSHEHAHLRLNPSQTNKLLLQGSDDPLICHGANNVGTNDDDHPNVEFKTLIAAATAEGRQCHPSRENHFEKNLSYIKLKAITTSSSSSSTASSNTLYNLPLKKVQNGCSLLTKQQLKVKAGLMSAQNQQQKQQQQQQQFQMQQQQKGIKQQSTQSHTITSSSSTVTNAEQKPSRNPRGKKKGALKLRFHHQALPLEYLNHYEASQTNNGRMANDSNQVSASASSSGTSSVKSKVAANANGSKSSASSKGSHENVRSWLQKIAEIQRTAEKQQQQKQKDSKEKQEDNNNNKVSVAPRDTNIKDDGKSTVNPKNTNTTSSIKGKKEYTVQEPTRKKIQQTVLANVSQKRVASYSDLPFMGEITLNISKPRRGRKPKKADICHLIYKNYGTVLSGDPSKSISDIQTSKKTDPEQHQIKLGSNEQPLNLCLRDQSSDLYSISSGDEDDVPISATSSNCPTPLSTPVDLLADHLLLTNLKQSMKCSPEKCKDRDSKPTNKDTSSEKDSKSNDNLHPVSAYYQKLLESGNLFPQSGNLFGLPIETIEKDNQLALKIPIPNDFLNQAKLEYPEALSTPSSIQSDSSIHINTVTTSLPTSQNHHQSHPNHLNHQVVSTQKRKRSAIFIPPIPAENTTNPATEVSICKFKFTGGAKPSLQEKKMLSVDAGGNYRYFSGTGDKSMRGYEFFPRESLQQTGLIPGVNCTGTFFSTSGEKVFLDIPPPSAGLSHEILQLPESPQALLPLLPPRISTPTRPSSSSPTSPYPPSPIPLIHNHHPLSSSPSCYSPSSNPNLVSQDHILNDQAPQRCSSAVSSTLPRTLTSERSKKKSRRSSQREKLEKTFKEKGFLIQTQQLESAEGATYCKFRQLKKFTRYLFRNWKDYLPDTNDGSKHIHSIKMDEKSQGDNYEDPDSSQKETPFLNEPHPYHKEEETNRIVQVSENSS